MAEYRLFYSWQNDLKDTKNIIKAALRTAAESLLQDGIVLKVDEDTRERVGKRNIDAEVLEKIRRCDIFLADLTPIITYMPPEGSHDLPKHMPNSNVMYEYGYALHAKGENRMIVLASLNKNENEHLEFMPFDINHDTITLFKDENSLRNLHHWIRKIIEDVDQERAAYVPEYASAVLFQTNDGCVDEITIRPRYKWIYYVAESHKAASSIKVAQPSYVDIVNNPLKLQQALLSHTNVVPASMVTVKANTKTTNLSYVPIKLLFENNGSEALDNLHISITSSDERVSFAESIENDPLGFLRVRRETDTFANEDGITQRIDTLNPQMTYSFDEVFVHAPHDIGTFKLQWCLSSRSFPDNGELTIHVEPEYEYDTIENDELSGTERVIDLEVSE